MTNLSAGPIRDRLRALNDLGDHLPYDLVALAFRLFPAAVFWASGAPRWRAGPSPTPAGSCSSTNTPCP